MGFDLVPHRPTGLAGEYFRRDWFTWPLLWSYCGGLAPELTAKAERFWEYEMATFDGLNARDSRDLAARLREELESGRAERYCEEREAFIASHGDQCADCRGEGKFYGAEAGPSCDKCLGTGKQGAFRLQDVEELTAFLEHSMGFEIH